MSRTGPLVALAAATVASIGGTRLSVIAIPWLVLTTTGDPVLTGLVGLAEMLPYVMAKALGGPLLDRLGARRVAIVSDCISALAIAIVPLLYWAGLLSCWLLLPAVAVIGVVRAPSDAAKQALVPSVARLGDMPLERVTGVLGASDRLAGTLGAAGAGILIALIGPVAALLVNGLTFVMSALILLVGFPHADAPRGPASDYRRDWMEGWQALRTEPVLVCMVAMIAVTNLFDQAYATLLLPVWVRANGLDASWVGIMLAVFSGGAIVGAAVAAIYGARLPRLLIYTLGFFCAGPLPFFMLAAQVPLVVLVPVFVAGGFAAGFLNPIISAILFERIAAPLVGRVIALVGALTWCLMPFGGLFGGILVDWTGISAALAITATLYLVAAFAPIAVPGFRQMRRPDPSVADLHRAGAEN